MKGVIRAMNGKTMKGRSGNQKAISYNQPSLGHTSAANLLIIYEGLGFDPIRELPSHSVSAYNFPPPQR